MIGTHHQAPFITGNGVLGDHACARLDVAFDEVDRVLISGVLAAQRTHHGIDGLTNVDSQGFIGVDETQCLLSVLFVTLDVEGQAHCVELRRVAFGP
ncbi:hypothetical protein D3C73_1493890 [compost metagenome]